MFKGKNRELKDILSQFSTLKTELTDFIGEKTNKKAELETELKTVSEDIDTAKNSLNATRAILGETAKKG